MVQVTLAVLGAASLRQRLGEVPKSLQAEVRRELRPIAYEVRDEARSNASWSSRIPRSLSVRIRFGRRPAVNIEARRQVAPHARPFEGAGGRGSFRHPVFGNRRSWVSQRTRPFLLPALNARRSAIAVRMSRVVDRAVARHGLR